MTPPQPKGTANYEASVAMTVVIAPVGEGFVGLQNPSGFTLNQDRNIHSG